MFEYFDIHSHLYFPQYDSDRAEEISRIKNAGIATVTIGADTETSKEAIHLAEENDNLFASVGQHPADITSSSLFDESFKDLASHPRVVCIGECGLDYFHSSVDDTLVISAQKKVFESHIELSLVSGKPLMLHIRSSKGTMDAYHDALDILEHHARSHGEKLRGNAHFFAGSMEVLGRFLALGFTVSFTGVLTFTHDYDEFVRYVPLNMMMSETDAPFVAPVPFRGKRSSPLQVPYVVEKIAEIRGENLEEVKKTLRDNALRFFKIPH